MRHKQTDKTAFIENTGSRNFNGTYLQYFINCPISVIFDMCFYFVLLNKNTHFCD